MEVRSEQSFSLGMQKSPMATQPSISGMRLTVTPDGTAVYKPVSSTANTTAATISSSAVSSFRGGSAASGGIGEDGSPAPPVVTLHGLNVAAGELGKKKRGRPRKYGPDGSMALALTTVSPTSGTPPGMGGFPPLSMGQGGADISFSGDPTKKPRGRPRGSGKKQQLLALGSAGIGFTPHVITVKAGEASQPLNSEFHWNSVVKQAMGRAVMRWVTSCEVLVDVSSKIMSFSQHGPRAVCILSANGAISNVTLRQAATSGGTVTYEGRFEILSLSGSFLPSDIGGQRSRTGGLSISLAGPDGRVLGGGVAGILTAASPVQVVVGSFIAEGKKELKHVNLFDGASTIAKLVTPGSGGGVTTGGSSPPSRGTPSGSSGGPASPLNQCTGTCNNSSQLGLSNISWK